MIASVVNSESLLELNDEHKKQYLSNSEGWNGKDLLRVVNVLNDLEYRLKHLTQPLIYFEMTSMKLMEMDSSVSINQLLSEHASKPIKKNSKTISVAATKEIIDEKVSIVSNDNLDKDKVIVNNISKTDLSESNNAEKNELKIDKIKNEWNKFIKTISQKRPSIGTALEHSVPTALIGNKLTIEVSGLPDFNVGNLNRNNQVIESFLKDYYNYNLKIKALMSDHESKPSILETNSEDNKSNRNEINLKENSEDGVVSRVIEVFDGEILR